MAPRTHAYAALCLLCGICTLAPGTANADYVRDGLLINLRTKPGQQYKIVKTLASGDQVSRLDEVDKWIQVRVDNGERTVGWVPKGYLTASIPASISLPQTQAQLSTARERIKTLEAELAPRFEAARELDALRAENLTLKPENLQLSGAERWRSLGIGALIALGGLVIGVLWPRGSSRAARRLKL